MNRGRKSVIAGVGIALLATLLAGALASGAGPRAQKLRLAPELGKPGELLPYGRSKLLLLGSFDEEGLMRIGNDGTLDRSFGAGGKLESPYGAGATVAPGGKILLASSARGPRGSDAAVTRLMPDGAPDPSFGKQGTALIDFGGAYDGAATVAVAPDGDILVGGTMQKHAESRGLSDAVPAVGRLRPNGAVDSSFANHGKRVLEGGSEGGVLDIAPLPNGGVVAEGEGYLGIAVWKLTGSGSPNRRFGKRGLLSLEQGRGRREKYGWEEELEWVDEVGVLPNSKLMLAATGSRYDGNKPQYRALALRLRADGRFDRAFGRRGWAAATFGGSTFAEDLVMLPRGIAVVAADAQVRHDKESDVAAIAFGPSGGLYKRFGHRGKARVDLRRWDLVEDTARQGDQVVILGQDRANERWLVRIPVP
jgi:uncharacterized delta-60 repeat protein